LSTPPHTTTSPAAVASRWGAPPLEGRVIACSTTPPEAGDRPWWAPLVALLAIVPALMALTFLSFMRMLTRVFTPSRSGLLGALLGPSASRSSSLDVTKLLSIWSDRNPRTQHTLLRVRTATGAAHYCRYAADPTTLPLQVGDDVSCWGRALPDGTLRARRLLNRTTGTRHTARVVQRWVSAAALASCVLILMALSDLLRT
jgi:hypothetical protein